MHSITFNLGLIHPLFRATDLTTRKLLHTRPSSKQHTSVFFCFALHKIAQNCFLLFCVATIALLPSSTQQCFASPQNLIAQNCFLLFCIAQNCFTTIFHTAAVFSSVLVCKNFHIIPLHRIAFYCLHFCSALQKFAQDHLNDRTCCTCCIVIPGIIVGSRCGDGRRADRTYNEGKHEPSFNIWEIIILEKNIRTEEVDST